LDGGSTLNYSYTVPNGKYTLKLFFVDLTSTAAGQRKFNVIANGTTVLKNFDIFAAAGATSTAVTKSVSLTVSNKTLSLEFKGVVGDAVVSAFELIPA
jgi:beta-galactosidase